MLSTDSSGFIEFNLNHAKQDDGSAGSATSAEITAERPTDQRVAAVVQQSLDAPVEGESASPASSTPSERGEASSADSRARCESTSTSGYYTPLPQEGSSPLPSPSTLVEQDFSPPPSRPSYDPHPFLTLHRNRSRGVERKHPLKSVIAHETLPMPNGDVVVLVERAKVRALRKEVRPQGWHIVPTREGPLTQRASTREDGEEDVTEKIALCDAENADFTPPTVEDDEAPTHRERLTAILLREAAYPCGYEAHLSVDEIVAKRREEAQRAKKVQKRPTHTLITLRYTNPKGHSTPPDRTLSFLRV